MVANDKPRPSTYRGNRIVAKGREVPLSGARYCCGRYRYFVRHIFVTASALREAEFFDVHQYVSSSVILKATYLSQSRALDHVRWLNNDIQSMP